MQKEVEEMVNDGRKITKGIYAGLALVSIMTKTWDAILDSKTRPAHVQGHGQQRAINEPFLIGGEYGQYPRADTFSMRQKQGVGVIHWWGLGEKSKYLDFYIKEIATYF